MTSIPPEMKERYEEARRLIESSKDIKIYSHTDCDGISSGAILTGILKKIGRQLGKDFKIEIVNLDVLENVPIEHELTIFSDLGSGQPVDKNANKDSIITISYTVKHGGRSLANIRGSGIKEVDYLVNDMQKASDRYQSQLFDMGEVKVGDRITFNIKLSSYTKQEGSIGLYISKCNMDVEEKVIEKLQKNAMKVTYYSDDSIEGDINLNEEQILFTSIPYDEGWHIYSDGKEVNTVKVAEGLLGANIGEGKHHIIMKYMPQGLMEGGIISMISLIIFTIMCIRYRRHG